MVKILNVGCGHKKILSEGSANLDRDSSVRPDVVGLAEYLPFKDNSFDIVFASHVLEHTVSHEQIFKEFLRVCRIKIQVIVPNFMSRNQHNDPSHLRAFSSIDELLIRYRAEIWSYQTWVRSKYKIIRRIFYLLAKIDTFWSDALIIEIKKTTL